MVTEIRKLITDCMIELFDDELNKRGESVAITERYLLLAHKLGTTHKESKE